MTTAQSFCYMALLKTQERITEQLKFLSEEKRSDIHRVLNELHDATQSDLRRRWAKAHEEEVKRGREVNARNVIVPVKQLSPGLQRWFSLRF